MAAGLLLDGSTGSTWRLEKVLETDGGDGNTTNTFDATELRA